jgi:hypothetical protein
MADNQSIHLTGSDHQSFSERPILWNSTLPLSRSSA